MTRMIYSTRWAKPRESTWSGTTWHLRQALAKRFEIEAFDNCFIGAKTIVVYGVKICPNTIADTGSVVTKEGREGAA